jgi:hypothetical protein
MPPIDEYPGFVTICEPCQLGKSKQLHFQPSSCVSSHPLEFIHSDLWSCSTKSLDGCYEMPQVLKVERL